MSKADVTANPDELTDSEIVQRYGGILEQGIQAFREDPSYVVSIAEAAGRLVLRKKGSSASTA